MPINRESRIENLWSSVTGATPDTGDFNYGELAINVVDKKVYFKDSTGNLSHLEPLPSNVVRFTSSLTAPTGVDVGHKWFDEGSGTEFTYIYDGNSYQWVDIAGGGGSNGGSESTSTNEFKKNDVIFLDYMLGTRRYFSDTTPSGTWTNLNVAAAAAGITGRMGMNKRTTTNVGTAVKFYRSAAYGSLVYFGSGETTECGFGVLNDLTDSTTDNPSRLIAGVIDGFISGPALPYHGAYFRYEHNLNDGRFACVVANQSSALTTTVDSGITYSANKWYDLKIVASGQDIVRFYINDDMVAGITSNIPTASVTPIFDFGRGGVTGTTGTIGIVHNYMYVRKVFS